MSAPFKVRWAEFSGTTDWAPCQHAEVRGEVLFIDFGNAERDLIPLHVIRGRIEIRVNDESAEER